MKTEFDAHSSYLPNDAPSQSFLIAVEVVDSLQVFVSYVIDNTWISHVQTCSVNTKRKLARMNIAACFSDLERRHNAANINALFSKQATS